MGGTITYSVSTHWKDDLFQMNSRIRQILEEAGTKTISITDLMKEFGLSDDTIKLFTEIEVLHNVAKIGGGGTAKRGSYELTNFADELIKLYERSSEEEKINKILHRKLKKKFFQYDFFFNFLNFFFHNINQNSRELNLNKSQLRNQFLEYCIEIYGTCEFIDRITFDNIYNFSMQDHLLELKDDNTIVLNTEYFTIVDFVNLNLLIERELKKHSEGMITRKLCEYLIQNHIHFYYGGDLTLFEVYNLILNLYEEKVENIFIKFNFHGGVPYPPIPSPHTIIKYQEI